MPDTILLMDNREDVLDKWGKLLENYGYCVLKAMTLQEAESILKTKRVHLAVFDIRMLDEDDENDISGLLLAQKPEFRPIPKIILTAYPSFEYARLGLAPDAEGQISAVNFIWKEEGPQALRQAIECAFANQVRLNRDLQIQWNQQQHMSFLYFANLLQPDLPNEHLVQRADELEDLIRRLFYDYQQIRIGRLLWHDDQRFSLQVLAHSPQGAIDPRVLVCAERSRLEDELDRMRELTPESTRVTKLVSTTETMHFGAATYALPAADMETVQPLRGLFQSGKERHLKTVVAYLLKEVVTAWHQRGQEMDETNDLMSLYCQRMGLDETYLTRDKIENRVQALIQAVRLLNAVEIDRGDGLITFQFPKQAPLTCPDPIATIYTPLERYGSSVVCKISPGQLTADNILVDGSRRTWLTDFANAGQAPQWWDFVSLETVIRFNLSQVPDMLAWQEFEECLVKPAQLDEQLRIQDVIADLRTSVILIEQIRRYAGSETGYDALPYYAGLLVWAVRAITRDDPAIFYTQAERMRGAHLLLAAAMIAQRLGDRFSTSRSGGILHLTDDGIVWIGDRLVTELIGQELDLLRCLYDRAGRLVSRQNIVESVFGEQYQLGDEHVESRINSLVRRLRVKIEPNPDYPHYIITIKGRGYRLQVGNKTNE